MSNQSESHQEEMMKNTKEKEKEESEKVVTGPSEIQGAEETAASSSGVGSEVQQNTNTYPWSYIIS